jgi:hypothetical protein
MARKKTVSQRRQKPMADRGGRSGGVDSVTHALYAKPKGRRIDKKFLSAPPDPLGA